MKKNKILKSFFSILLSMVMVLSMSIVALADPQQGDTEQKKDDEHTEYTIRITMDPNDEVEHTFDVYQIFEAEVWMDMEFDQEEWKVTDTYLNKIKWGSNIVVNDTTDYSGDLLAALQVKGGANAVFGDSVNAFKTCTDAASVAQVLAVNGNKAPFVRRFAKIVNDLLKNKNSDPYTTVVRAGKSEVRDAKEYVEVTVAPGYYLIKDKDSDLNVFDELTGAHTNFILLQVVRDIEVYNENNNETVQAKAEVPSIEKFILEEEEDGSEIEVKSNTASIGDTINYKIISRVPDMTGYEKYFFVITDTMDKGLTFCDDPDDTKDLQDKLLNIKVKIGNKNEKIGFEEITPTSDKASPFQTYYVDVKKSEETGETTLKIVFNNFIQYQRLVEQAKEIAEETKNKEDAIVDIIITYPVTLNKDADLSSKGNINNVDLIFSNNPNVKSNGKDGFPNEPNDEPYEEDGTTIPKAPVGKTPPSKVVTYTTGIKLIKVNGNGNALTGAKFSITGDKLSEIMVFQVEEFAEVTDGVDVTADQYWKLKDGTYTKTDPNNPGVDQREYDSLVTKYIKQKNTHTTEVKTNEQGKKTVELEVGTDGILVIQGLNAGIYSIVETQAPVGYNRLKKSIELEIQAEIEGQNTEAPVIKWTVSRNDADAEEVDQLYEFQVVNHEGVTLPSSGGIGTTIFYILGVAFLIAAGVGFFITRKKYEKKED